MSKFDLPTAAAIRRGVLSNKIVAQTINKPLADCPQLCTQAAILEGRPVVVVFAYGYVSTSAFDAEDLTEKDFPQLGELLEIRPLKPDDDFHPERVRVCIDPKKFPRTNRLGGKTKPSDKPERAAPKPKAEEPVSFDDTDGLADALGLEG